MSVEVSAPAKIILFGEHAVVYDQPAIAVPISNLRATATIDAHSSPASALRIVAEDLDQITTVVSASSNDALGFMARMVLDQLALEPPPITVRLHSDIPIASGLGSGAAIATALGRALCAASDYPLTNEQLNVVVYEIEKHHHGTPSGIDNTVIVYEQPVYFRRSSPIERLTIAEPFHIVVADTGQRAPTKVAVSDVRQLYTHNPAQVQGVIDQIGKITRAARRHIEDGRPEYLGGLMNENHQLLQKLTVSSPELDRLVQAANEASALGAKLSGGGRGGNMIALVKQDTVTAVTSALYQAGATRVFDTVVQT